MWNVKEHGVFYLVAEILNDFKYICNALPNEKGFKNMRMHWNWYNGIYCGQTASISFSMGREWVGKGYESGVESTVLFRYVSPAFQPISTMQSITEKAF